ncbi:hypothetical protein IWQ61_004508 [Dispira simplex]|nr:hypothetical protein IWQ61_004508 [Dispira simplex]
MATLSSQYQGFEALNVTMVTEYVMHVKLNRPKKLNAFNPRGEGRGFCAGLDVKEGPTELMTAAEDMSRKAYRLRSHILDLQSAFTAIQVCDKPVIAAVHGVCIGAGVDLITACDIRYCTKDSIFSVKEVDIGMAADVGTLQRLQKVVGSDSWVREVCLTAREFGSAEAIQQGLVSGVLPDFVTLFGGAQALGNASGGRFSERALDLAKTIAEKSPIATMGTK